jgi:anti-anti-sigma regulatory factor
VSRDGNELPDGGEQRDGEEQRARGFIINVQRSAAGHTVVHLVGDLIGDATASTRQTLIDELARDPTQLIVDGSAITRFGAGGVQALAAAAAVAGEADLPFCLVSGNGSPLRAALAAEQMSELFEIFTSTAEAVQDLR